MVRLDSSTSAVTAADRSVRFINVDRTRRCSKSLSTVPSALKNGPRVASSSACTWATSMSSDACSKSDSIVMLLSRSTERTDGVTGPFFRADEKTRRISKSDPMLLAASK